MLEKILFVFDEANDVPSGIFTVMSCTPHCEAKNCFHRPDNKNLFECRECHMNYFVNDEHIEEASEAIRKAILPILNKVAANISRICNSAMDHPASRVEGKCTKCQTHICVPDDDAVKQDGDGDFRYVICPVCKNKVIIQAAK